VRQKLILLLAMLALAPGVDARAEVVSYIRPVHGAIVRHFEPPPTPYTAGHRGLDMAVTIGTPVMASAAGTVAFAGQVGGSLFVSIDHADGLRSTYSFLSSVLVSKGTVVPQGYLIGRSGPGHPDETTPCLHFGLRRGDTYLDPEPYLLDTMRRNIADLLRLVPA
jgi:murein DD-endopeptidase MepM/ murein hydrolase activator NlpD